LANLCERSHSVLTWRWDSVFLTAKIMLFFVRFWPIYAVIHEQCYSWSLCGQV